MSNIPAHLLNARLERGLAFHHQGKAEAAAAIYNEILTHQPRHAAALQLLGVLHLQAGDPQTAEQLLRKAVRIKPDYVTALNSLGVALRTLRRADEALQTLNRALALDPNVTEAEFNRGLVLMDLGRVQEALAGFDRTLAARPQHIGALISRGDMLERLGRPAEAVAAYSQASALQPAEPLHRYNTGCALHSMGRIEEARAMYRDVIAQAPEFADAHRALGESHLLTGDFATGWAEYEWRWKTASMATQRREFAQPQWRGEDISGVTILLHGEQGFGDCIQFSRFAATLAARGAKVLLEVPAEIAGLMDSLPGVAQVLARGDALPPFNVHCPLLSVPLALGADGVPDRVPAPYLTADPARRDSTRAKIADGSKRLIGLAWSGRKTYPYDRDRSVALSRLTPLFAIPNARFVALQPDYTADDRRAGVDILAPGPMDFRDTAALIAELDLVISVDTVFAHLAGALGKPVWVLLAMMPDWRWQLGRDDSPWYPTARLFRQPAIGDWPAVIADVAAALAAG